ncbi:hypothetical protein HY496_01395 [Candidatus Woesearchaeota archaeon]|nr:hypothetical protein [Candidatus Woesearchaeota archaeon]
MKKKGGSEMWWIIMTAILAILIVILVILWFRGSGGKAFEDVDTKIGGLKDCDNDNVGDLFDKCKCDVGVSGATYEGCPEDVTDEAGLNLRQENCNTERYDNLCKQP